MKPLKNIEIFILILLKKYSMKTNRKKNKNKNLNKTRRISGGEPKVIMVQGYYDDGVLLYYRISRNRMNTEQQQKYADKHKVFYSIENPSFLEEIKQIFSIDSKKVKKVIYPFFFLKPTGKYTDTYETIVVHDKDDIKKIETTNKIITNINNNKTITNSTTDYTNNLNGFIPVYKQFIETNSSLLLEKVLPEEKGMDLLKTPIFLNIIGMKFGFIKTTFTDDLEKIKEEIDKSTLIVTAPIVTAPIVTAPIVTAPIVTAPIATAHATMKKRLKALKPK